MGNSFWKEQPIRQDYDILETLGRGAFSSVRRCRHKVSGKEFAVKVIKKRYLDPKTLGAVKQEVEILQKIDHPHVVHLQSVYDTPEKLYIVLELLTGGELFERIAQRGSFSEQEAAAVIRTLGEAVKYMHSIGVVHRDLKPENLVYASKESDAPLKVTDFGLAKYMVEDAERKTMHSAVGTIGYMAPEILKNELYGPQVDLWSIGVILFVLLCGYPPFYDATVSGLFGAIKKGAYCFADPYWSRISDGAKHVVYRLLSVDPCSRMTVEELLIDPWVEQKTLVCTEFDSGFVMKLGCNYSKTVYMEAEVLLHLPCQTSPRHTGPIQCIDTNHQYITTGGRDATIRLWKDSNLIQTLRGHADWVTGISYIPNTERLVSVSADHTLKLWIPQQSSTPVASGFIHQDHIEALSVSSPNSIITAGLDQQLFQWDSNSLEKPINTFITHLKDNSPISYYSIHSPQSLPNLFVAGSTDGVVRLWDARTPHAENHKLGKTVQGSTVRAVKLSDDGHFVLSGGAEENALLRLWDLRYVKLNTHTSCVWRMDVLQGSSVWDIQIDAAFRHAVVGGNSHYISSVDIVSQTIVQQTQFSHVTGDSCIHLARYTSDEDILICSSASSLIRVNISNLQNQTIIHTDPPVKRAKVLPDGIHVATEDSTGNIKIWNSLSGQSVQKDTHSLQWSDLSTAQPPSFVLNKWFSVEIHLGNAAISLKNPACFASAIYLSAYCPLPPWMEQTDIKIPSNFKPNFTNLSEFKVNFGEWLLSKLFRPYLLASGDSAASEKQTMEFAQLVFTKTQRNTLELLNVHPAHSIASLLPSWISQAVLHQVYKIRDPKIRFELLPEAGTSLQKLSKGERYTASDAVTIRRVAKFVLGLLKNSGHPQVVAYQELERSAQIGLKDSEEKVDSEIPLPESIVTIKCLDQVLEPNLSLRSVRDLIWNNGMTNNFAYISLFYSIKDKLKV